jgi:hypothetical protein
MLEYYLPRDNARKVRISLSTVHFILKKHLKVREISARWVQYLLTDEQRRQRVKVAKKLLQMFQKCDKNSLPMSSQVMKLESIILSPSEKSAPKSGPLNTTNKSAGEKGQKYHWEVLQRRST